MGLSTIYSKEIPLRPGLSAFLKTVQTQSHDAIPLDIKTLASPPRFANWKHKYKGDINSI